MNIRLKGKRKTTKYITRNIFKTKKCYEYKERSKKNLQKIRCWKIKSKKIMTRI